MHQGCAEIVTANDLEWEAEFIGNSRLSIRIESPPEYIPIRINRQDMVGSRADPLVIANGSIELFLGIFADNDDFPCLEQQDGVFLGCGNIDNTGIATYLGLSVIIPAPGDNCAVAEQCDCMPASCSDFDDTRDIGCI